MASWAAENGFDAMTTTLTVSPYQDAEAIALEGEAAAAAAGIEFVRRDFTDLYPDATRRSRELGMYRQNYCGCVMSDLEAREERARRREQRAEKRRAAGETRGPLGLRRLRGAGRAACSARAVALDLAGLSRGVTFADLRDLARVAIGAKGLEARSPPSAGPVLDSDPEMAQPAPRYAVRLVPITESMWASLPPVHARRSACARWYLRARELARSSKGVEFATSTPSNATRS